jgi:hypothetical protein
MMNITSYLESGIFDRPVLRQMPPTLPAQTISARHQTPLKPPQPPTDHLKEQRLKEEKIRQSIKIATDLLYRRIQSQNLPIYG